MTAMTISDLRPAGHALLADSEGFISDLSDEELGIRGAWHHSCGSNAASLSGASNASASGAGSFDSTASASNSDSNVSAAADSGYSAADSGYSAAASLGSYYPMPKPPKASCY